MNQMLTKYFRGFLNVILFFCAIFVNTSSGYDSTTFLKIIVLNFIETTLQEAYNSCVSASLQHQYTQQKQAIGRNKCKKSVILVCFFFSAL